MAPGKGKRAGHGRYRGRCCRRWSHETGGIGPSSASGRHPHEHHHRPRPRLPRCSCRDSHRRRLGARCPRLFTDGHHRTWAFAVDVPAPHYRRTTVRRGRFPSPDAAEAALRTFLEGEAGGFSADPNQTVADYLHTWLAAKALVLKPTTMVRYRDYVHNGLVPAFGEPQVG
ncbi:hypothetical protein [Streptomyces sp. NPDC051677]|uniref:hypothetical protein n=1 Tax=Streptomyces sp. NPDC051677 TaxID=3365669 RepID=UPI0037D11369